jgi:hypothetical protein
MALGVPYLEASVRVLPLRLESSVRVKNIRCFAIILGVTSCSSIVLRMKY